MRWSDIAKVLQKPEPDSDFELKNISTDTRTLQADDVFLALKGEHFDGHQFIDKAISLGASAIIVSEAKHYSIPHYIVPDTLQAYGQIAACYRTLWGKTTIGITGSVGKTTTKAMLQKILSEVTTVHATQGNHNNEIGVPKTLLALKASDEVAVIEMGAGRPGDIAYLGQIAQPDIALVTACAPAHLSAYDDISAIAKEKGSLYSALRETGIAILNETDTFAPLWRELIGKRPIMTYGVAEQSMFYAKAIRLEPTQSIFCLCSPHGEAKITLSIPGQHNILNALAAATCAYAYGASLMQIQAGLEKVQPEKGRLFTWKTSQGATLIDDTYNANPASVSAAIHFLANHSHQKYLVLGDMGALGDMADEAHEKIGMLAKQKGIDALFAYGPLSKNAVQAFGKGAEHFENQSDLICRLEQILSPSVTCLVKGSRYMNMDKIVTALTKAEERV